MTFLGTHSNILTWNELYTQTCEILLVHYPYKMAVVDKDNDLNSINKRFSYTESDIVGHKKKLSNGLWVKVYNNTKDNLNATYKLLEKMGFSSSDLSIEIKED